MVVLSSSPAETQEVGREFGQRLAAGTVLNLRGDLGAGKTEFVKGLAQGLGAKDQVTSPTFTLIHEYRSGRLPLFHLDLYRLRLDSELDEIGFDDYLEAGGVCAVEWGDKFVDRLPAATESIAFEIAGDNSRIIRW
ncbi:MAG: tRNA (adenosine(37)-N6)-threonylcarbamoyltransferase complex ATPase subunit type 1 TsaE [Verrucomicrobia bacterium]|nr:tRNA (adenosine(37)-N6)-threonylcarbamoyltransferase complex ATPase subunit type 1 TsaE [Verrucomicrobiota bacterium]